MSKLPEIKSRDHFATKFGIIAAAAGSAVGLGNIWKFPYVAGNNGGAAFFIVYLGFTFLIGLSIMMSEFIIGRNSESNVHGAFRKLAPGSIFKHIGFLGIAAAFLILSFYGVVAGWSFEYISHAIKGTFMHQTPAEINVMFDTFTQSSWKPVFWFLIFMIVTGYIVLEGIKDGIEKYTKILMPMLFLIIIILDIRAITLPGAKEGLKFLFEPDFSKLTPKAILEALGQAFFSLSLGMGAIITYGSYVGKNDNLGTTSLQVTITDTLVAILAGVAIFPAVFAFNIDPTEGPGLVYKTLPVVFQQMPAGQIFSFLFFVLLLVAALTSSISLLEVIVAFMVEELNIIRKRATVIATILVVVLGTFCSLSLGALKIQFFGMSFFDLLVKIASDILLPLGGLFISVFIGWYLDKNLIFNELSNNGSLKVPFFKIFIIIVKYIAPLAILLVLLNSLGILRI